MKRYLSLMVTALLLAGVVSGCARHTAELSKPAPLQTFDAQLKLKPLWKGAVGGRSLAGVIMVPALDADQLIAADSRKGKVVALDRHTGKMRWEAATGFDVSVGVVSGYGIAMVGSAEGDVLALNEADGTLRWQVNLNASIGGLPKLSQKVVIVRTVDGRVYALDAADGRQLWMYVGSVPALTLHGVSQPLMYKNQVIIGQANGRLLSLSLDSGKPLWEVIVATPKGRSELERVVDIDATPVLYDGVIYATAYQGRTVAVSPVSGRLLWTYEVSSHAGLAVDDKTVYVSDSSDRLWALDRATGTLLWKQERFIFRGITAPMVFADTLLVGDGQGYLHIMSRLNGELVGRYRVGTASIDSPPQLYDDVIYARNAKGKIHALKVVAQ